MDRDIVPTWFVNIVTPPPKKKKHLEPIAQCIGTAVPRCCHCQPCVSNPRVIASCSVHDRFWPGFLGVFFGASSRMRMDDSILDDGSVVVNLIQ